MRCRKKYLQDSTMRCRSAASSLAEILVASISPVRTPLGEGEFPVLVEGSILKTRIYFINIYISIRMYVGCGRDDVEDVDRTPDHGDRVFERQTRGTEDDSHHSAGFEADIGGLADQHV